MMLFMYNVDTTIPILILYYYLISLLFSVAYGRGRQKHPIVNNNKNVPDVRQTIFDIESCSISYQCDTQRTTKYNRIGTTALIGLLCMAYLSVSGQRTRRN
jgi:hypothetical protein